MKTKPKKVFEYEPSVNYSFGHVLIAAKTKEEADKFMVLSTYSDSLKMKFTGEIPKLKYSGKAGIIINNAGCE